MNQSGILPTEYKVLIKPKLIEERTAGGIIIPEDTKERDQYAQMEGTVIDVSPKAFEEWLPELEDHPHLPKCGDQVLFAKYSGAVVTGRDGEEYRLVNDKDIGAVFNHV